MKAVGLGGFEEQDAAGSVFHEEGEVGEDIASEQGGDGWLLPGDGFKDVYLQACGEVFESQCGLNLASRDYSAYALGWYAFFEGCEISLMVLDHPS